MTRPPPVVIAGRRQADSDRPQQPFDRRSQHRGFEIRTTQCQLPQDKAADHVGHQSGVGLGKCGSHSREGVVRDPRIGTTPIAQGRGEDRVARGRQVKLHDHDAHLGIVDHLPDRMAGDQFGQPGGIVGVPLEARPDRRKRLDVAIRHQHERFPDQFLARSEIISDRAVARLGLGDDRSQRDRAGAFPDDDPERRVEQRLAPLRAAGGVIASDHRDDLVPQRVGHKLPSTERTGPDRFPDDAFPHPGRTTKPSGVGLATRPNAGMADRSPERLAAAHRRLLLHMEKIEGGHRGRSAIPKVWDDDARLDDAVSLLIKVLRMDNNSLGECHGQEHRALGASARDRKAADL